MDFAEVVSSEGVRWLRLAGSQEGAGAMWTVQKSSDIFLWLNLSGTGAVLGSDDRMFLRPQMYAIFGGDAGKVWKWTRLPGGHDVHLLRLEHDWLRRKLGSSEEFLHPDFAKWLRDGGVISFSGLMSEQEKDLVGFLGGLNGELAMSGPMLEGRLLEWVSLRLFRQSRACEGAGFCHRVASRSFVTRALEYLRQHLDQPLCLDAIAAELGVSTSYISRQVRQQSGKTLREHLRELRVKEACERLSQRDARVTDVALDVGYQSLSHFAKAFRAEMGVTPKVWVLEQRA